MVSVVGLAALLAIIAVNVAVAALLTRLLRVRLSTEWGSVLYALLLIPVAQFLVVLVLGRALPATNLGTPAAVVGVTILLPLSLGMAFDYFWQPSPEEVELPERYQGSD
jgi:hypothetical protein